MRFRSLKAEEIEVRVSQTKATGCQLLLYKDARCDMNILDETVGAESWQRRHYECKGNLFCSVGIKAAEEWIWKDDAGAESFAEKEKGEASDSFKRACFNWGIGRELYSAPFIWINRENAGIEEKGGKPVCKARFYVEKIAVSDQGKITGLSIKNTQGKRVFVWTASTENTGGRR